MIVKIKVSKIKLPAFSKMVLRTLHFIKGGTIENDLVGTLMTTLEKDVEAATSVINKQRGSSFTETLKELDEERDKSLGSYIMHIKANLERKVEELKIAARYLFRIITNLGLDKRSDGYLEQSAKIQALFLEMKKEDSVTALKTIRGEDVYAELIESEKEFETIQQAKSKDKAKDTTLTVKQAKQIMQRHFLLLLDIINFIAETTPDVYDELIGKINEVLASVMAAQRTPKKSKKGGNGKGGTNNNTRDNEINIDDDDYERTREA